MWTWLKTYPGQQNFRATCPKGKLESKFLLNPEFNTNDKKTYLNDWFDLLFIAGWQTFQYTEGQIQLIKSIKKWSTLLKNTVEILKRVFPSALQDKL